MWDTIKNAFGYAWAYISGGPTDTIGKVISQVTGSNVSNNVGANSSIDNQQSSSKPKVSWIEKVGRIAVIIIGGIILIIIISLIVKLSSIRKLFKFK